jgi:hypothetical protein
MVTACHAPDTAAGRLVCVLKRVCAIVDSMTCCEIQAIATWEQKVAGPAWLMKLCCHDGLMLESSHSYEWHQKCDWLLPWYSRFRGIADVDSELK